MTNNYQTEKAKINWPVTLVLGLTFLAAVTVVPWYGFVYGFSAWAWTFFAIFLITSGIGIGSGYHRLWSHRAYEANWLMSLYLAIVGVAWRFRTASWSGVFGTVFTIVMWMIMTRTRIQSVAVSGLRTLAGC